MRQHARLPLVARTFYFRPEGAVILDTSMGGATKVVLSSLHVRLKSPNALWRLILPYHKAVLEGRGLNPIIFGQELGECKIHSWWRQLGHEGLS